MRSPFRNFFRAIDIATGKAAKKPKYPKWTDPKRISIPEEWKRITHGKVWAGDKVWVFDKGFKEVTDDYLGTNVSEWWLIIRKQ